MFATTKDIISGSHQLWVDGRCLICSGSYTRDRKIWVSTADKMPLVQGSAECCFRIACGLLQSLTFVAVFPRIPFYAPFGPRELLTFLFNYFNPSSPFPLSLLSHTWAPRLSFPVVHMQLSYMVLDQGISPVTFSVGNTMKRVAVVVSSVMFFRNPVALLNWAGSFIAIAGTYLYSLATERYAAEKMAAAAAGKKVQ